MRVPGRCSLRLSAAPAAAVAAAAHVDPAAVVAGILRMT